MENACFEVKLLYDNETQTASYLLNITQTCEPQTKGRQSKFQPVI